MKYKRTKSKELREEIIREYLTTDVTYRELAEKYDVKGTSIRNWVSRSYRQKKVVPLQSESNPIADMARKKTEEQSPEIARLQARIRELEMQNLALTTLIDVAERNGLQIRKKSGAKQ